MGHIFPGVDYRIEVALKYNDSFYFFEGDKLVKYFIKFY